MEGLTSIAPDRAGEVVALGPQVHPGRHPLAMLMTGAVVGILYYL